MATIALRFHTVNEQHETLQGGHAYCLFSEPTITVRELLLEKLRSEFRKARASQIEMSSLQALLGHKVEWSDTAPARQNICEFWFMHRFQSGDVQLLVNDQVQTSLDHVVELSRSTKLEVLVVEQVAA